MSKPKMLPTEFINNIVNTELQRLIDNGELAKLVSVEPIHNVFETLSPMITSAVETNVMKQLHEQLPAIIMQHSKLAIISQVENYKAHSIEPIVGEEVPVVNENEAQSIEHAVPEKVQIMNDIQELIIYSPEYELTLVRPIDIEDVSLQEKEPPKLEDKPVISENNEPEESLFLTYQKLNVGGIRYVLLGIQCHICRELLTYNRGDVQHVNIIRKSHASTCGFTIEFKVTKTMHLITWTMSNDNGIPDNKGVIITFGKVFFQTKEGRHYRGFTRMKYISGSKHQWYGCLSDFTKTVLICDIFSKLNLKI